MPLQILNYPQLIEKINTWGYFLGYLIRQKKFDECQKFCELINPIIDKCLVMNTWRNPFDKEEENSRR